MPKCASCFRYFHPDWCIESNIRGDNVIQCMFCRLDKDVLTIDDDNGNVIETVTKMEASVNYLKYLDELSTKPNIAKIIAENKK